jgi:hypothetical protein
MPRPSPLHSCTSSSRSRVKNKVRLEAGVEAGGFGVGRSFDCVAFILMKKQSERIDRKNYLTSSFNIKGFHGAWFY